MPSGYWTGLVEGFQGKREKASKENYDREQQNRQLSDRVFTHLLASRDPEVQALALQGLMQPVEKQKGMKGFMGGVTDVNPLMSQLVSHMNEQVPDDQPTPPTSSAPAPSVASGSAGMSTNVPVKPGSAPMGGGLPGQALPAEPGPEGMPGVMGPPGPPPGLMGQGGGAGMPPPPPPESKWKRRGTGIPTAEEIAEQNEQAKVMGGLKGIAAGMSGSDPATIERAQLGHLGAPPPLDSTAAGPTLADPQDPTTPIPTIRHRNGTITLVDGTPPPAQLVGYVKPATGGRVSKTMRDAASPTGYSSVTYDATGTKLFSVPTEFVPPPAFSGTATVADPNNPTVPIRAGMPRGGGPLVPVGDEPTSVKSKQQQDAEALLAAVDDEVKLTMSGTLGKVRGVKPEQRDQLVRTKAQHQGLPYTTYDDVVRAAKGTAPITAREKASGGSLAEKVRARVEKNRAGGGAGPTKPTLPPPPSGP